MSATRRDFLGTTALAGGALGVAALVPDAVAERPGGRQSQVQRAARAAAHPHPRRHRLHRPAPGALRRGARPQGDALQPRPHQPGAVQGRLGHRGADRRPRPEPGQLRRAEERRVGRGHRQPDHPAALGARGGGGGEGPRRALRVHLDHLGLREERHPGRRRDGGGRHDDDARRRERPGVPAALRPAQGAGGEGSARRRSPAAPPSSAPA